MKRAMFGLLAVLLAASPVSAQTDPVPAPPAPEADPCEVPAYILFGEAKLDHVKKAVEEHKKLNILVLGSGSSVLPGTDGANKSYPGRLEELLQKRFPGGRNQGCRGCEAAVNRSRHERKFGKGAARPQARFGGMADRNCGRHAGR